MDLHSICLFVTGIFYLAFALSVCSYCSILQYFLPSFSAFAYLFIHQWRLQLLPLFSYCEQCCYDHGCINISLRFCFKYFSVYIQKGNCLDHFYDNFYFFEEASYCFPQWLYHFTFSLTVHKCLQFLHIFTNVYYFLFLF